MHRHNRTLLEPLRALTQAHPPTSPWAKFGFGGPKKGLVALLAIACFAVVVGGPGATAAWAGATGTDRVTTADDIGGLPSCPADDSEVTAVDSTARIVKVNGLLDPVVSDFILQALAEAETDPDTVALVIWMNSKGSVLDRVELLELADRIEAVDVPTAVWVGQPGSTARGGTAELAGLVDTVAVSPNSTIGLIPDPLLAERWSPEFAAVAADMEDAVLDANQAIASGLSVGPLSEVATIGSFVAGLDGFEVFQCQTSEGDLRTLPKSTIQMSQLTVTGQLFHTVASPEVAYLFFALGLGLLIFELYTAGVGVAGVLGAGFVTLGAYGLWVLPTRWWGVALMLLAFIFMAIDIQTNVPRFYTVVGLACYIVASWFLFDGIRIAWVTLFAGIVGAILYAYSGMPSMVRTRFSTPTIGRKWMIGELGEATTDISPEGTVEIREVAWRAITNRATPVKAGDRVRVVGLDRLILEVEPEEGGAKDYRERGDKN